MFLKMTKKEFLQKEKNIKRQIYQGRAIAADRNLPLAAI
jgi:hypothetical protein